MPRKTRVLVIVGYWLICFLGLLAAYLASGVSGAEISSSDWSTLIVVAIAIILAFIVREMRGED